MIERKYFHPGIKWYTRLWPPFWFGNIDDPEMPPKFFELRSRSRLYRFARKIAGQKAAERLWWFVRNPMHNFMHYVVGVSGLDIEVYGKNGLIDMFAPQGWHWLIVKYGWLCLPYFSYHDKEVKVYAGWGDSGQLGFEIKGKRGVALYAWAVVFVIVVLVVLSGWRLFLR